MTSSIITDYEAAKDSTISDVDRPFTLIEWLVNTGENFGTPDEFIANHVLYIKSWYKANSQSRVVGESAVVNNYSKFLREVLLTYANDEEARYLKNLDWQSPYDLDMAVPF